MQAMVHSYERKEFHRLKMCLRILKTQDQYQLFINSFSIVVFVEETTYNLVNLKDQTSLNISHNANPPFLDE
jgi:2-iminoacetate synthase ThiH